MNSNTKLKLEYQVVGTTFSLLNIYLTLHNRAIIGLVFGCVGAFFFIKAIRVKNE